MNIRYTYNLGLALVAGFLVVASQAFTPGTAAWLTFAIAIAATLGALAIIRARVGLFQRVLSGVTAVIGAWTVIASLVFSRRPSCGSALPRRWRCWRSHWPA